MNIQQSFMFIVRVLLIFLHLIIINGEENNLPDCSNEEGPHGLILVSTLDGNIAALSAKGRLIWELETGPLLLSNIHNLELTNNGQWIRIIPSLSGSLYKFDGSNIDAIPITADNLLTSSFKYSDDMVIAGGREVRNYGVNINSGKKVYECSLSGCKNNTEVDESEDIVIIERSSYVVRAVEPRSGGERWNFSIAIHNLKVPYTSCINIDPEVHEYKITAILPNGHIIANSEKTLLEPWDFKFNSPIVGIWKWDGRSLSQVDLFEFPIENKLPLVPPSIYVGMYKKQLYIFESEKMKETLVLKKYAAPSFIDSQGITRIPWKPISASNTALVPIDDTDGSTALSVLYSSEYINGNGYYFYATNDPLLCDNQTLSEMESKDLKDGVPVVDWMWWKEIIVISLTVIFMNIMYNNFGNFFILRVFPRQRHSSTFQQKTNSVSEILPLYSKNSSSTTETSDNNFASRYLTEFDTINCLGRGGFGVVFHVIKKFDDCHYAVKRILLPRENKARERVMREVKALAKLDHRNIVRYYNAWIEYPPVQWQKKLDEKLLSDCSNSLAAMTSTSQSRHHRSTSVSIDVINLQRRRMKEESELFSNIQSKDDFNISISKTPDSSDSFIVFKSNTVSSSSECSDFSHKEKTLSHADKKSIWRKPRQRPQSLDITSQGNVFTNDKTPPAFLYIQMQLCREESLKDWLKNNKNREKTILLNIFTQILEAVEYVHLQGLIHRDLKPSNIFFSLEGQIKIGDFGLVTTMDDAPPFPSINSSPAILSNGYTQAVGTKLYMSPEQYKGEKYDYKVDIYSLGVIFFELLIPFFTEMERVKALTNLRNKVFPLEFPKEYKHEKALLNLMIADDPKDRPTTFGIRARPPFLQEDAVLKRDFHFKLPKI
ncbi:eukaryotic translation initiation factor 2-alpha kinase [Agrilus planipennis]|uniref:non-specific serine/threonine protein kinase n=1 Tax=Agrilus planipennis TaxID=224129 RepID=A0A1W4XM61_AGRPL|nr:eukaryotic translation initiation factor 2-alpha kinase [Agrilus planipennis]XP_018333471.1 eukaryotic translation initiation factor 2-alpha kinase [Agrilus planipennis]